MIDHRCEALNRYWHRYAECLYEEDPSTYGEGTRRTFPVVNLLWWKRID